MKTILIPVDFSEACDNALNYAIEFAKKGGLEVHLLNVYNELFISDEPTTLVPSTDELIQERMERLKSIRAKIHQLHGEQLQIEVHCLVGEIIDTINSFAAGHRIDLVIMGMQGGGYISEKIFGSTVTSLMRNCVCPVLGIGRHMKFKQIRHVILATDYEDDNYVSAVSPLVDLVRLFDAQLSVLYIIEPTIRTKTTIADATSLNQALRGIDHTSYAEVHVDFVAGINHFISEHRGDIAAVIPRNHSFFHRLFHEPNTKQLAFNTDIPVLALHI